MKVILLKPVSNLGLAGGVVNVSDGYAANFLFPKKLAEPVNKQTSTTNITTVNRPISSNEKKVLDQISNIKLVIHVKTNSQGKLYESIKAGQIAGLLRQKKKINVKANCISFSQPIKEIGEHYVAVKIANQISNFKLIVEKL